MRSLKTKVVALLFCVILAIIMTFYLLGNAFLEIYYIEKEKAEFLAIYHTVKEMTRAENADIIYRLSKISSNSTTTIMVSDNSFSEVYSSSNIFTDPRNPQMARIYLRDFASLIDFSDNADYKTKIVADPLGSQRLFMVARITPDYLLFLSKPIESIKRNVKHYNEFLIFASIIVMIFGGMAMYLVSSKFLKPVYEMFDISKRIANMDFSKRYQFSKKHPDELDMLGASLNIMSDKLSENILQLSQANIDLRNDLTQKERTEDMRKEFLQNASHELKTPISVIASYAEMLKDKIITDEEDCQDYYNVIYDETEKMGNIVTNLLGLAQLESQNRGLNLEKFDVSELVSDVLAAFGAIIEKSEIVLEKNIEEDLSVVADKFLIERVITNFISNALEHIDENKKVIVNLIDIGENQVYFGIYNSTQNILDSDKIWASFYKSDVSKGHGLGLSIVKAIMESHDKEYGFLNKEGGVEFFIKM